MLNKAILRAKSIIMHALGLPVYKPLDVDESGCGMTAYLFSSVVILLTSLLAAVEQFDALLQSHKLHSVNQREQQQLFCSGELLDAANKHAAVRTKPADVLVVTRTIHHKPGRFVYHAGCKWKFKVCMDVMMSLHF